MPTRRAVLTATGSALAATTLATGTVAADHFEEIPEHVTIGYDQPWLERYQPLLAMDSETRSRFLGLYGWRASSPEFEYDWACYWASYTHQTGLTDLDSHRGDHEPLYVAVDEQGNVDRVCYTAYHWLKAESRMPTLDGTNPVMLVNNPYHHYLMAPTPTTPAERFDVEDLVPEMPDWLDNGLEESLDTSVGVARPETILAEPDWWATGSFGLGSLDALYARTRLTLGLDGAAASDLSQNAISWLPFHVALHNAVEANPQLVAPRLRP
ncbi:hypothetical protein [Halosegnis longus]|uniref:hypothetical protein n=1 Tax=Halosegnis longus TaxID=2216012 RepID=UPI00129DBBD2|nr:hypothetical protein [Halosegnis longus]